MNGFEVTLFPASLVFVGIEPAGGGAATAWEIVDRVPREGEGVRSFTSMSVVDRAVFRALITEALIRLDNTDGGAS